MRWRDVNTLCRDITLDKFDPQVIVGLSRGGLTPGVMMSHWLQKPFKPVNIIERFSRVGRLSLKKDR